jgi:hypothetical protein
LTIPSVSPVPEIAAVAAVDMGYGHLRAARAIADALGTRVLRADTAPIADAEEQRLWQTARRLYEVTSRTSQLPGLLGWLGAPLRAALDGITSIPPLHPHRDLSSPNWGTRSLDRLIARGLGRGLAAHLATTREPLVTTFFSIAIAAAAHGVRDVHCIATDSDLARSWAPLDPRSSPIVYSAPTRRARRRLLAYGIAREQIEVTGFPLPHELVGGPELPTLARNLAARLVRLDPKGVFREQLGGDLERFLGPLSRTESDSESRPPLAVFAVGGAGAQAELARTLLVSLRPLIEEGKLRLCLVAGARPEIAARFVEWTAAAGLSPLLGSEVQILDAPDVDTYLDRFHELLSQADILWTKPSEMVFFGALGLPLVLTRPVGVHERYNRRWAIENGVGLEQRDARHAGDWLREYLAEGTLAAAAWFGYLRLPKQGLYRIVGRIVGRIVERVKRPR